MAEPVALSLARVLLVDDHPPICSFLAFLLRDDLDIVVVGQARTGADAIRLAGEQKPDLLVLDLFLPDLSAIQIVRRIRATLPDVRVLIYTGFDDVAPARELLRLGVRGWLSKRASNAEVVAALRAVVAGFEVLDPGVVNALGFGRQADTLTARERNVLELVAAGFANAEIATALKIALPTVETHLVRVLAKLGARSRGEAARIAHDLGLATPLPRRVPRLLPA